jgi:glycosyltransferase involved in cell wall biosynthesis
MSKLKLQLIYRNKGYSIERVFEALIDDFEKQFDVEKLYVKKKSFWPAEIIYNIVYCFFKKSNGINHITGDVHYCALLMPKRNTVLTIHDTVSLNYNQLPKIQKKIIYYLWYYFPLKKLKYITCISNETKNSLLQIFPWLKQKIVVIYNPIDKDYKFIEKKFDKNEPVILHIGTKPNKNLERTILAISSLKCHFRIIGKLSEKQIALLKENSINFSNRFNLTDEEIVAEYKNCDIVSFPTLFEGFGMPVIEGQKTGRIVLTSNIEPLKEIAGEGAVFVNPYDVDSIRESFTSIIFNDTLRDEKIKQGIKNVERFSKDVISAQYIRLYQEMHDIT